MDEHACARPSTEPIGRGIFSSSRTNPDWDARSSRSCVGAPCCVERRPHSLVLEFPTAGDTLGSKVGATRGAARTRRSRDPRTHWQASTFTDALKVSGYTRCGIRHGGCRYRDRSWARSHRLRRKAMKSSRSGRTASARTSHVTRAWSRGSLRNCRGRPRRRSPRLHDGGPCTRISGSSRHQASAC